MRRGGASVLLRAKRAFEVWSPGKENRLAGYVDKAMRDVARWSEQGLITDEAAAAIRADLASRRSGYGLPHIFALLGAILLVLSVLTFVAANWDEIPRLARVAMLAGLLIASYAAAVRLFLTGHDIFGQTAVLVGSGVYGGSIMLVSQMYHIYGNPADAVLAWALGTTLAAAAFRAPAVWVMAFAIFCLWSAGTTAESNEVHWIFPLVVAAMAALAWWIHFTGARHLVALALTAWVVSLPIVHGASFFPYQTLTIGLCVGAIGAAAMLLAGDGEGFVERNAPIAMLYGYVIAFCGLFNMQFFEHDVPLEKFVMLAAATLVLSLAVLAVGRLRGRGMALSVAYLGFSIELVGIYFKTFGTLLNTSIFFFTSGVMVIALAWFGMRLRKRGVLAGDFS